jgi:hypothetical protein
MQYLLFQRRVSLPVLTRPPELAVQHGRYVPASTDPFRLTGPALVSFSGGRTSAYMLRRVLDAHRGTLPTDVHVLFANTGKERPETLEFVEQCGERWGVPIVWLEYRATAGPDGWKHGYAEVTFDTASRNGEPFTRLIETRSYLPNQVARFCTQELKVRLFKKWMIDHGYQTWSSAIGIRADEPGRLGRASRERWENVYPLADAGVTLAEVMWFWRDSRWGLELDEWLAIHPADRPGWDLDLRPDEGNCTCCFLKGRRKLVRLIADRPAEADWWIEQERAVGAGALGGTAVARFSSRFTYEQLREAAVGRGPLLELLDGVEDEPVEDCHCTD